MGAEMSLRVPRNEPRVDRRRRLRLRSSSSRRSSRTRNTHIRAVDLDSSEDTNDAVDVEAHFMNSTPCIDLTSDDEDVIDLTSPHGFNDSSVIILNTPQGSSSDSLRRSLRSHSNNQAEPSTDLPDLDISEVFDVSANNDTINSPAAGRKITCPICLDDDKQIRRRGDQLHSTVCGHIFCNICILRAVEAQHCCPTCRKKLTKRQVHPIFI